jgi:hypothetical protein
MADSLGTSLRVIRALSGAADDVPRGVIKAYGGRQIDAALLPPIPPDHLRLTHNTGSNTALENFRNGAPFRFRNTIDYTTDAFSTNDQVASFIASGKRESFGPLTVLIDLPAVEHNKRLLRHGWVGYEPVPNQNIIGHLDESGTFVPLQRYEGGILPTDDAIFEEPAVQPYMKRPLRPLPFAAGQEAQVRHLLPVRPVDEDIW